MYNKITVQIIKLVFEDIVVWKAFLDNLAHQNKLMIVHRSQSKMQNTCQKNFFYRKKAPISCFRVRHLIKPKKHTNSNAIQPSKFYSANCGILLLAYPLLAKTSTEAIVEVNSDSVCQSKSREIKLIL